MAESSAPEVLAIQAANRAYYAALSSRDMRAMQMVWSRSVDDVNIAPPIAPVAHIGWPAVKANYESFWSTLDELTASMEQPTIKMEGNVAWVFGIEHATRRTKDGQVSGGPNFGTSIFVKRDERWLMVFHQSTLKPK
ncbi:MAG TPA: nuclear transport factor 2 family protein [Pseudolabrys sp.]|nr:nuclear transport factor 2 family protein [Pseudolabrys sp.]